MPIMPTIETLETDEEKKDDFAVDQAGEGDTVILQESYRGSNSPPGSSAMEHRQGRRS